MLGASDARYVKWKTCEGVESGAGEGLERTFIEIVVTLIRDFCNALDLSQLDYQYLCLMFACDR